MLDLIRVLRFANLLSFSKVFLGIKEAFENGVNLGFLLSFLAKVYKNKIALSYEEEDITYHQIHTSAQNLAYFLNHEKKLKKGNKLAIACSNHPALIYSIFASNSVGLDIYMLSSDLKRDQLQQLQELHHFDFIIYDELLHDIINDIFSVDKSLISYSKTTVSVWSCSLLDIPRNWKAKKHYEGKIVVLTAGTTGIPKSAVRKTKPTYFFSPFVDLIKNIGLNKYQSVYIATPIYHGFGLSALFLAMALGQRIYLMGRFDIDKLSTLIEVEKIDCISLVPSMLQRLLAVVNKDLTSLSCIVSGGASLSAALVSQVQDRFGDILYNLYGTSEAGFCMMATPKDLKYNLNTVGKPINRVEVCLDKGANLKGSNIGLLKVKCLWSSNPGEWVDTGDLAHVDTNGYYYLAGRNDDMIISGGENVYPYELEVCLTRHPLIAEVAVIGVDDRQFGQRLKAFVVVCAMLNEKDLKIWLSDRIPKYQMPRDIIFIDEIPKTTLGKIDKKVLCSML